MFLRHLCTWTSLFARILFLRIWHGCTTPFYRKSLQLLRNENILFTKIFQSLANCSSHQIDPELRAELHHYTANSSYTEAEINYELLDTIETDYNLQIDRHVINSGMIALVFRGVDSSGNPVIIKMKRLGITEQLQRGCADITAIYNWLAFWKPDNIYIRILRPFIRNIDDIIEQCDFAREISNLRTAKEDFAPLDFLQIPAVYNRNTGPTEFILMEYIDGTHTLPPNISDEARLRYMEQYCICTSFSLIANAIQHTDLHSGNLLFTKTGFAFIDYGMAVQMSDEEHDMVMTIVEIIHEEKPIHEIDFIETFKNVFDPPLNKANIRNLHTAEDLCISILQPMLDNIDVDELHVTDNLILLNKQLVENTDLNRTMYKLLLGFSMMGGKFMILGERHTDLVLIKQIERRAITYAYNLVMS